MKKIATLVAAFFIAATANAMVKSDTIGIERPKTYFEKNIVYENMKDLGSTDAFQKSLPGTTITFYQSDALKNTIALDSSSNSGYETKTVYRWGLGHELDYLWKITCTDWDKTNKQHNEATLGSEDYEFGYDLTVNNGASFTVKKLILDLMVENNPEFNITVSKKDGSILYQSGWVKGSTTYNAAAWCMGPYVEIDKDSASYFFPNNKNFQCQYPWYNDKVTNKNIQEATALLPENLVLGTGEYKVRVQVDLKKDAARYITFDRVVFVGTMNATEPTHIHEFSNEWEWGHNETNGYFHYHKCIIPDCNITDYSTLTGDDAVAAAFGNHAYGSDITSPDYYTCNICGWVDEQRENEAANAREPIPAYYDMDQNAIVTEKPEHFLPVLINPDQTLTLCAPAIPEGAEGVLELENQVKKAGEDTYYTITGIGDEALANAPYVTGIILPSTIKKIGKNAFKGDYSLQYIDMSETEANIESISRTEEGSTLYGIEPYTLIYLPKGDTRADENIINNIDGMFTSKKLHLTDGKIQSSEFVNTQYLPSFNAPHSFTAEQVINDRVLTGVKGQTFTTNLPYVPTLSEDVDAYTFQSWDAEQNLIAFSKTEITEPYQPVVLKFNKDGEQTFNAEDVDITATSDEEIDDMFAGTVTGITNADAIDNGSLFTLENADLTPTWNRVQGNGYVAAFRAFFYNPEFPETETAAAKMIFLDDEVTAIKTVDAAKNKDAVFNLSGLRVNKNYKGIVVKNGKKSIQK